MCIGVGFDFCMYRFITRTIFGLFSKQFLRIQCSRYFYFHSLEFYIHFPGHNMAQDVKATGFGPSFVPPRSGGSSIIILKVLTVR